MNAGGIYEATLATPLATVAGSVVTIGTIVQPNATYSATVGQATITYKAAAGDTRAVVATKLRDALAQALVGYTFTAANGTITVSKLDGAAFVLRADDPKLVVKRKVNPARLTVSLLTTHGIEREAATTSVLRSGLNPALDQVAATRGVLRGFGQDISAFANSAYYGVEFERFESTELRLSASDDQLTINMDKSVAPAVTSVGVLEVALGAGNDSVTVLATAGNVTILGGSGDDTVTVGNGSNWSMDHLGGTLDFRGDAHRDEVATEHELIEVAQVTAEGKVKEKLLSITDANLEASFSKSTFVDGVQFTSAHDSLYHFATAAKFDNAVLNKIDPQTGVFMKDLGRLVYFDPDNPTVRQTAAQHGRQIFTDGTPVTRMTKLEQEVIKGVGDKVLATQAITATVPVAETVQKRRKTIATRYVDVQGGTGNDKMYIRHDGDNSVVSGTLTATTLTIDGKRADYSRLELVDIRLGSGNDSFVIASTGAAIELATGGGVDTVRVESAAHATTVHTGDQDDVIEIRNTDFRLEGITSTLTLHGDAGYDTVTAMDLFEFANSTGTLTSTRLSELGMTGVVDYHSTEFMTVLLGLGNDNFTIESTHAQTETAVSGHGGRDAIRVKTISSQTSIGAGEGNDTITVGDNALTLRGIQGLLLLDAEVGADTVNISNSGETLDQSGTLAYAAGVSTLTGFGIQSGKRIEVEHAETYNLALGQGKDDLSITGTSGDTTNITTGGGADKVKIEALAGRVTLKTEGDKDEVTLFDGAGDTAASGSMLVLDGGGADDTFTLRLGRGTGLLVDLQDTGDVLGSSNDRLVIETTSGVDEVHVDAGVKTPQDPTPGVVTIGQGTGTDRVAHRKIDHVTIDTGAGDDFVLMDDNSVATDIYLGLGKDFIQVGTVPTIFDTGNRNAEYPDGVPVADTSNMTHGNSALTNVFGGGGDDTFEVSHNQAALFLFGEDGDDLFVINTFLVLKDNPSDPDSQAVNLASITGGAGADRYQYLQNAPVHISGGDGFDTIVINGTPIGDVFLITDQFVAGAGRMVMFDDTVERIEIRGSGGDDDIYVLSTNAGMETFVRGGSGNDRIHLGGDHPVMIVDPPQVTVQNPGREVTETVTTTQLVTIDPPQFAVTVPFFSWWQSDEEILQQLKAQYNLKADGHEIKSLTTNFETFVFSWWFWSWSFSFPVSKTAVIDPDAYQEERTTTTVKTTSVAPTAVQIDPARYAFKVDAVHNLRGIRGKLTIDGSETSYDPNFQDTIQESVPHQDQLIVHNEQGDAGSGRLLNTTVTLEDGSQRTFLNLQGFGLGGGATPDAVPYEGVEITGFEGMEVRLGSGNDQLTIEATHDGTTTVVLGGGNDTVQVEDIDGTTHIFGGAGDDVLNVWYEDVTSTLDDTLHRIDHELTFDGDRHRHDRLNPIPINNPVVGLDFVWIDTKNTPSTADDVVMIDVAKLDPITGEVLVEDVLEPVIVDGVPLLDVNGQPVTRIIGKKILTRPVPLYFAQKEIVDEWFAVNGSGQAYKDVLNIRNTGQGTAVTATLSETTFTADAMAGSIRYATGASRVDELNIWLGAGSDAVQVEGTNAATRTFLRTGAGNDAVSVGRNGSLDAVQGELLIDAEGGANNKLAIDDSADPNRDADVVIGAGFVSGLAPATIHYHAAGGTFASYYDMAQGAFTAGVTIRAGQGGNTITVQGARQTAGVVEVTEIFTGSGADVVTVTEVDPRYTVIHGQAGDDAIALAQAGTAAPAFGGLTVYGDEGADILTGGVQADVLVGGAGSDTVTGGQGDDVLAGDNVHVFRTAAYVVVHISSPEIDDGAGDRIEGGEGNDIAIGGAGGDRLLGDDGHNILLGDGGFVQRTFGLVRLVHTVAPPAGGRDTITSGSGDDVIIGGADNDDIAAGLGSDLVLGDSGEVFLNNAGSNDVRSTALDQGGDDTISGGAGTSILIGGFGADRITTGSGSAVVAGDNAEVQRDGAHTWKQVRSIDTSDATAGGDTVVSAAGTNIILGGLGQDTIALAAGTNIVLGDNGVVALNNAAANDIATSDVTLGAKDTITIAGGSNTVLGGAAGDVITIDGGSNVVVGDNGRVARNGAGVITLVAAHDAVAATGGDDRITSQGGSNIVFGGVGNDTIEAPQGLNVILGDNGEANFTALNSDITTTSAGLGGNDRIVGGLLGNTLIGGAGEDTIIGGIANDQIAGDGAYVTRQAGVVKKVHTIDDSIGGIDRIEGGDGSDVILGGAEGDIIVASLGGDIILGDGGVADLTGDVYSTSPATGGADQITGGNGIGAGNRSIILGGADADVLTGGNGNNIILGDGGYVMRTAGVVRHVYSIDPAEGGADVIRSGAGDDLIVGGAAGDDIEAGLGSDIVLGDSGEIFLNNAAGPNDVRSIALDQGGDDTITGGAGTSILIGGFGADEITTGSGSAVIAGDNAVIERDGAEVWHHVRSTDTGAATAGNDIIASAAGSNIIVGGLGQDDITLSVGINIVLGDNGSVALNNAGRNDIVTADIDRGAGDTIRAGSGSNTILGGFGADTITLGGGTNVVVGDNGRVERDGSNSIMLVAADDATQATGGGDTITSDGGSNIIVGGVGRDRIMAPAGTSIILGDNGAALFAGSTRDVYSTHVGLGDDDTITGGAGDNIILGGFGADLITGGAGRDVILGDSGVVGRNAAGVLQQVATSASGTGGNDTIDGAAGADILLGGAADDEIAATLGGKTILGDSGVVILAGITRDVYTVDASIGGVDRITSGADGVGNVILGGAKADVIAGGLGHDVVLGDSGHVVRNAASVVLQVGTTDPLDGDADTITGGDGDDVIIGGVGSDSIAGGEGRNVVLGDTGTVWFELDALGATRLTKARSSVQAGDAADSISAGSGADVIVGGQGKDTIAGGNGDNVVFGDYGEVTWVGGLLELAESLDTGTGGDDQITTGTGADIVVGGYGSDTLTVGGAAADAGNVVFGDSGIIDYTAGVLASAGSTAVTIGGDDAITAGSGGDVIVGGAGADIVQGGDGSNVVLGDTGTIAYNLDLAGLATLDFASSTVQAADAADQITTGSGNDVVVGGQGGDTLTLGDGANTALGDYGTIEWTNGLLEQAASENTDTGGNDTITSGSGADIVLGGWGSDTITASAGGADAGNVLFGDSGAIDFTAGVLSSAASIAVTIGGADQITGGSGNDVIVGGSHADTIVAGHGDNVVLGDTGAIDYHLDAAGLATLDYASSTVQAEDSADAISTGSGDDIVVGGQGGDTINVGDGDNLVLGDYGTIEWSDGLLEQATSENTGTGGNDTIIGGTGADIALGGFGSDTITVSAAGVADTGNVVFGDSGFVNYTAGVLSNASSTAVLTGGVDVITSGSGGDVIVGGVGADTIAGGDGANVVLGDNGTIEYHLNSGLATLDRATSTVQSLDAADSITTGSGYDVVVGGQGGDTISLGDGGSTALGDYGTIEWTGGLLELAFSENTGTGGNDTITGGTGADIVIGGFGSDLLTVSSAASDSGNVVFGDSGLLDFAAGILSNANSTDVATGADDHITSGSGGDVIVGGAGSDTIVAGDGNNVVLGDTGTIDYSLDAAGLATLDFATSTVETADAADSISTGSGNDIVVGGQGGDTITLGDGANMALGDYGTIEWTGGLLEQAFSENTGTGGNDTITSGTGADIVLGGFGSDQITVSGAAADAGNVVFGDSGFVNYTAGVLSNANSTDVTIGGVDAITSGSGGDVIVGGAAGDAILAGEGNNVVLGDTGTIEYHLHSGLTTLDRATSTVEDADAADSITTGAGNDVVVGGQGGDTLTLGDGGNTVLGDYGRINWLDGLLDDAGSLDTDTGGDDTITGGTGVDIVIGGFGNDLITVSSAGPDLGNVVFGDSGWLNFTAGVLGNANSTDVATGGIDVITTGSGSDVIVGGAGADTILAGNGNNVVLGDTGSIDYSLDTDGLATLDFATSTVETADAADSIETGSGADVVVGGQGGDTITLGDGANTALGDYGTIEWIGGLLEQAFSENTGTGGDDTITSGTGADIVVGGFGSDVIKVSGAAADAGNVVFGDSGFVNYTAGALSNASSMDVTTGGVDLITSGSGNDVIVGGAAGDTILAGEGNNVVLGDTGTVEYQLNSGLGTLDRATSTVEGADGTDTITAGDGNDVVVGGQGGDTLTLGSGDNTVLGDYGRINWVNGLLEDAESLDTGTGGDDAITTGTGADVVLGGYGSDNITVSIDGVADMGNVVFGDSGSVDYTAGVLASATSTAATIGGTDTITTGSGGDVIVGGAEADHLYAGEGANVVLGDNGLIQYDLDVNALGVNDLGTLDKATSLVEGEDDADIITAGAAGDVVIGGQGNDTITIGGGANTVLGDYGIVTWDKGLLEQADSGNTDTGGDDIITTGTGADIILGGFGSDVIMASVLGTPDDGNVVFGDSGSVNFTAGVLASATSTAATIGGTDTITTGSGGDVIVGGAEADHLYAGEGANVVLGDNGLIQYDLDVNALGVNDLGTLDKATSLVEGEDDADIITAGAAGDVVIGGQGNDTITIGDGANTVLGDYGTIRWEGGLLEEAESLNTGTGGDDAITTGTGADVVLGGYGKDTITVSVDGVADDGNVVFGDSGFVNYTAGVLSNANSTDVTTGGVDLITSGSGNDVIVGGVAGDTILAGAGNNVVLGDTGTIEYQLNSGLGTLDRATSTVEGADGIDVITTGDGNDVVVGGQGGDTLTLGNGDNTVLGDYGRINWLNGLLDDAESLSTGTGGNDTITAGTGIDIVLGGYGNDTITVSGTAADSGNVVFGDSGFVNYTAGVLSDANSTDVITGGVDLITSGSGSDVIIGGADADTILAGQGDNVVLGDTGTIEYHLNTGLSTLDRATSTVEGADGTDTITTGDGNDVVVGGQGGDTLTLGNGDNTVLGDYGRINWVNGLLEDAESLDTGTGGNDTITTGTGADVVLGGYGSDTITVSIDGVADEGNVVFGDSGSVDYTAGVLASATSTAVTVGGTDTITTGSGGDVIVGGAEADHLYAGEGANVVLGDNGLIQYDLDVNALGVNDLSTLDKATSLVEDEDDADIITAGAAGDVVIGGQGNDTITIGDGANTVLGDYGIVTWDKGLLEQADSGDTDTGGDDIITTGTGADIILGGFGSDVIMASVLGTPDDGNVVFGDSGSVNFTAGVLASATSTAATIGGTDTITTGSGGDVIVGGAEADHLYAGEGANVVLGDNGLIQYDLDVNALGVNDLSTLDKATSLVEDEDDADIITAGAAGDVVIGGQGNDTITIGGGANTVLGDYGIVTWDKGLLEQADSGNTDTGGDDIITTGTGADIILGGFGSDVITASVLGTPDDGNVVFGDSGSVNFTAGVLASATSTAAIIGGTDTITTGSGGDVIVGGAEADHLYAGEGANVVLGDNGLIQYDLDVNALGVNDLSTLDKATSLVEDEDDADIITAGAAGDVVIGGQGNDTITIGDGANTVLGDYGIVTWDKGLLEQADSGNTDTGGDDIITTGTGVDVVLGGYGSDTITVSVDGVADEGNVVFGDSGFVNFTAGVLSNANSTDVTTGGVDLITSGSGNDVIVGGVAGDTIHAGQGNNVVLGDTGAIEYHLNSGLGTLDRATSTVEGADGIDVITTGDGNDVVVGGQGGDTLTLGNGDNTVLGDYGRINWLDGLLDDAESLSTGTGGNDTITAGTGIDIVLGGYGNDTITVSGTAADSGNVVFGDSGFVNYTAGVLSDANSTDVTTGGVDLITSGSGSDVIIGGADADTILAGQGDNVVLGDTGTIEYHLNSGLDTLDRATSTVEGADGIDVITTGDGNDVVVGGQGGDTLTLGNGDNIVLGDYGRINWVDGLLEDAESLSTGTGGNDIITTGTGADVVLGGYGSDTITVSVDGVADEGNVVFGDSGFVNYTAGVLSNANSTDVITGGVDLITSGSGNDVIVGGVAGDTIHAGQGNNVVLGDTGTIEYHLNSGLDTLDRATSTVEGADGTDAITTGDGNDVVVGGQGGDTLTLGNGDNTVLGDYGRINWVDGLLEDAESLSTGTGGNDTITSGTGIDIVLGGYGNDSITVSGAAVDSGNVVFGDSGFVNYTEGALSNANSTDVTTGGADVITSGSGNDVIIGGADADTILAGQGNNVVLGDTGTIEYQLNSGLGTLDRATSTVEGADGIDVITTGDGNDVVLGGQGGDTLTLGNGDNTALGDYGRINWLDGLLEDVESLSTGTGGNDTITTGTGIDIVLGGYGNDTITVSGTATDSGNLIFGDSGFVNYTEGVLSNANSTDVTTGGVDLITSGSANDVIIGGADADTILAGQGNNIVLGDTGTVEYHLNSGLGTLDRMISTSEAADGSDSITAGDGNDVVIGGGGADTITVNHGDNIVLGDYGSIEWISSALDLIQTLNPLHGGNDTVTSGDGTDILVGGSASDHLTSRDGADILLGDQATIEYVGGVLDWLTDDLTTGNDVIVGGLGDDIIIGGLGQDSINGSEGHDLIFGDEATLDYEPLGHLITATSPSVGGPGNGDVIHGNLGDDVIVTGDGNDVVDDAGGDNVIVAGNAVLSFASNGDLVNVTALDPSAQGQHTITGSDGNDILLGSADGDLIFGNGGDDLILGDGGVLVYEGGTLVDILPSAIIARGGRDTIHGGAGIDHIMGGADSDEIHGGSGEDVIFGDHARFDPQGPRNAFYFSISTQVSDGGAGDLIYGDENDDRIIGGQGGDTIFGGSGEDDITGGHNILADALGRFGSDGGDVIDGGTEQDVVLGDNGMILRSFAADGTSWLRYTGPFTDVIRHVQRYDDVDLIAGHDSISGGDGADILHGQRGNDTLHGGEGDDEAFGELGNDNLTGGGGRDYLLGDVGVVTRVRLANGQARLNTDGSWHKDVLLTDMAWLSGNIGLHATGNWWSATPAASLTTVNALLNADLVLLAGRRNAAGHDVLLSNWAWDSRALLLELLADGDDVLAGGEGHDVMFGQRGNDTMTGDGGNDLMSGGTGNDSLQGSAGNDNVVGDNLHVDSATGDAPNVLQGQHVIASAGSVEASLNVQLGQWGSTVVAPVQVSPGETPRAETSVMPFLFNTSTQSFDRGLRVAAAGAVPGQWVELGQLEIYASAVTDVGVHHQRQLRGNDIVAGGEGVDTLVGDDQVVVARTWSFTNTLMEAARDLTLRLLDVSDDFSDLVYRNFDLLGNRYNVSHTDVWVTDIEFQLGADSLLGEAGNDVMVGDDSSVIEPTYVLPVHLADDFEHFIDGVSDSSHELAGALVNLVELQYDLRDVITTTVIKNKTYTTITHHADLVFFGNDNLDGGAGHDLVIGDALVVRTPVINLTAGQSGYWHDSDWWWYDDWNNGHNHWDDDWDDDHDHDHWDDDHHHHGWGHGHHHRPGGLLKMASDTITGGSGDDVVYGDNLAVSDTLVTRGSGISNSTWNHASDDAEDAAERIAILTDSADYWARLNGDEDHDDWDDDWPFHAHVRATRADSISGGDGNDILFGQEGNDTLRGENGDDWLIGGDDNDSLVGGSGYNNSHSGHNNSSTLRWLTGNRMVNWDGTFSSFGVPYAPFGSASVTKKGVSSHMDDFAFLTPGG